jgi:hypothetical protein
MEERIKAFIETAINNTIPVLSDALPGVFPSITYHFYNDGGGEFGGGIPTERMASCQIDFWYDKKTPVITEAIKNLISAVINEKTFSNPIRDGLFESDKKKYHDYITFDLIKKESEV